MSQQNVELLQQTVRAYNAGFETGDTSDLEEVMHPDVEWYAAERQSWSPSIAGGKAYAGGRSSSMRAGWS